jgi:integrase
MPKITKRVVDSVAATDGRRLLLWDDELKGFGLLVLPSGVKTYIANYRVGGRLQRQTIGRHGVLTPEQARDRARKILGTVADGRDPVAEKREDLSAKMTVAELGDLYLAEGPIDRPNKKASTWATDASNLRRHVVPLLGKRPARSLSQPEIAKFQADVAAGRNKADVKTKKRGRALVAGGPGTAARSLGTLSAVLSWAVGRKLIDSNPARGVPLLKMRKRDASLTADELSRLVETVEAMQDAAELSRNAATAIKLLAMTGCRKGEILGLKWAGVDFEHGLLRLPDSKTGQKAVALGASALAVLADLPREGEYVCRPVAETSITPGSAKIGGGCASAQGYPISGCTICGTPSPRLRSLTARRFTSSGRRWGTHRAARPNVTPTWRKTRCGRRRNGLRPVSRRHRSADGRRRR